MEVVLSADDRMGMWLCGPTFSSADVALTCLMFSLEILGLDEQLWKGGRRPNLAVYQVRRHLLMTSAKSFVFLTPYPTYESYRDRK